ncbi:hypothetical protein DL95DRAFT_477024 [Leptodontidium sp. 2 PMI_412]|nr:hypothetical protein DL95DRAFT_477024 [Leptodontidium sp. 2 PMI_412]
METRRKGIGRRYPDRQNTKSSRRGKARGSWWHVWQRRVATALVGDKAWNCSWSLSWSVVELDGAGWPNPNILVQIIGQRRRAVLICVLLLAVGDLTTTFGGGIGPKKQTGRIRTWQGQEKAIQGKEGQQGKDNFNLGYIKETNLMPPPAVCLRGWYKRQTARQASKKPSGCQKNDVLNPRPLDNCTRRRYLKLINVSASASTHYMS